MRHMHLQWFAEGDGDPGQAGSGQDPGGQGGQAQDAAGQAGGQGKPGQAELLKADGTWAAQLPDRFKKDQGALADLLKHKNLGEVIDRLYESERQLADLQARATGAAAEFKVEDYAKVVPGRLPDFMSLKEFRAYSENLKEYLADAGQEIKALAAELKVSPAVAQRFLDLFTSRHINAFETSQRQYAKQREDGLNALKKQWGGEFEANEDLARRAVMTFGGPELLKRLSLRGLENDDILINTFCQIGKLIGEGHLVPGRAKAATHPVPGSPASDAQKQAALKRRYSRSPELTGEGS
jgi:hypothetical protein